MRNRLVAALAAVLLGSAAYLWFRSPTDKPAKRARTARHGDARHEGAGGVPDEVKGVELHGGMGGGVLKPDTAPRNVPASMAGQQNVGPSEYKSPHYGLRVRKPSTPGWVMADDPARFLIADPGKVVEMHCNPGPGDPRFATIYIYALRASGSSDGSREVAEIERLDKKAPPSEFKVEEERRVTVSGESMIRRVTSWNAEGRPTKFLSFRCIKARTLYVVLAFTDPGSFEAFLPDFDSVVNSLQLG